MSLVRLELTMEQTAYERVLKKSSWPEEYDQLPFKFPQQEIVQETTLKTITEVFETPAINVTQELITSTSGSAVENVTAAISETFGNNATSTEITLTNFTLDAGVDFIDNSTEVMNFVNTTMREVGTTYAPEHYHHNNHEHTIIIILAILLCLLIISLIAGFGLYFYKKKSYKNSCDLGAGDQNRTQMGHVVSFYDSTSPNSANSQQTN